MPRRAALVEVLLTLLLREGAGYTLAGKVTELVDRKEVQCDRPVASQVARKRRSTERHGVHDDVVAEERELLPPGLIALTAWLVTALGLAMSSRALVRPPRA
jgi:hypothetical protein